jgi:hypothetical protein
MSDIEKSLNDLIESSITSGYPINILTQLLKLYIDEKFKDLDERLENHIEYGSHYNSADDY